MEPGNRVVIEGRLIERDALRHTPGGVAIVKFRIAHESTQVEAETQRKVGFEVEAVAFDREARLLASAELGMGLGVTGFLDRKSRNSGMLVLHATQIEFLKNRLA